MSMKKTLLLLISWLALCAVAKAQCPVNRSLDFDPNLTPDYVQGTLSLSASFTVEGRFFADVNGISTRTILAVGSTNSRLEIALAGGVLNLIRKTTAGGTSATAITTVPPDLRGTWHHVALTRNISTGAVLVYLDGSLIHTNAIGTISVTTLRIGAPVLVTPSTITAWDGQIDEVRVWSVVRTATEIANNRNCWVDCANPNLAAYYRFDQGTAYGNNAGLTTLNDCDGNSNADLLGGFALSGATSNWVCGDPAFNNAQCNACPPTFTFSQDTCGNVAFINTTPGQSDLSFAWVFGDGGASTQASPQHAYGTAGTYTVVLSATPNSGGVPCTATQVVSVNGSDDTPPSIICTDKVFHITSGNPTFTLQYSDILVSVSDNCCLPNEANLQLIGQTSYSCADACLGNIQVLLKATDCAGNIAACIVSVRVQDDISPTAICYSPITLVVGPNGTANLTPEAVDVGSFDNCGDITARSISPSTFTCPQNCSEIRTVVLRVEDCSGNVGLCTALVNVEDHTAPVAHCKNVIVSVGPNGTATLTPNDVDDHSTDNCAIVSRSLSPTTFPCPQQGCEELRFAVLEVADCGGLVSQCTTYVTVRDLQGPTAVCWDTVNVSLGQNGMATITPAVIDAGSFDNCAITNRSLDISTFACPQQGCGQMQAVKLRVEDCTGNFGFCTSLVRVQDKLAPTLTCPPTLSVSAALDVCASTVNLTATGADNCGIVSSSYVFTGATSGSAPGLSTVQFFNVGVTLCTLTAADACNNTRSCAFTVTVLDNVRPVFLNCPPSVTVQGSVANGGAIVTWQSPVVTDNCGDLTLTSSIQSGSLFPCGSTVVIYLATDQNNNTATCSFTVTVDCGIQTCICSGFTDLSIGTQGGGVPLPVACGQTYTVPCPTAGQVLELRGKFGCMGGCFPDSYLPWKILSPAGAVVASGELSGVAFSLLINSELLSAPGTYQLVLSGRCDDFLACPCTVNLVVNCPNPDPCSAIRTFLVQDNNSNTCCFSIAVNNQSSQQLSAVKLHVLSGGSLPVGSVTPKNGWEIGGFDGSTSAVLVPAGPGVPTGFSGITDVCLKNLTAPDQYVEVQYLSADGSVFCRDTLHLTCDFCIAVAVDTIACDSAGRKKIKFCVSAAASLTWTINSIVIMAPPGITVTPSSFSLPNLAPGAAFCGLEAYIDVAPGTNPDSVCFGITAHHADVTAGQTPLECCMIKKCVDLPDCLCDPRLTYAEQEEVQSPDGACCREITLHQLAGTVYEVQTHVITPGVTFEGLVFVPGSPWKSTLNTPDRLTWTLKPAGTRLPALIDLPTLCLKVPVGSASPQQVEILWLTKDSTVCRDTVEFNCKPKDDCVTVDSSKATCVSGGTATITVTVTNTSNPPTAGGDIHLVPIGPAPFTLTPSIFPASLAPGESVTITATATGVTTDELWFTVGMNQLDDKGQLLVCCIAKDTLKVKVRGGSALQIACPANLQVSCESFDPTLFAYGQAVVTGGCCTSDLEKTVDYAYFDTLCNRGTITRTFRAVDFCSGSTASCNQRVLVSFNPAYFVKFPADQANAQCNANNDYGHAEIYDQSCGQVAISYSDELLIVGGPGLCYKIARTWRVFNWCTYNPALPLVDVPNPNPSDAPNDPANLAGVTVAEANNSVSGWAPTVVKIMPNDLAPTNYATFWNANANGYAYTQIIWVTDSDAPAAQCPVGPVQFCDPSTNDAGLWNEAYWNDPVHGSHDLCESPADLHLTATDACAGTNVAINYVLFLDLNGDGAQETAVSSTNLPAPNTVNFGNANNPNYSGGTPQQFDRRQVPTGERWGFGIQTEPLAGNNKTVKVMWVNSVGQSTAPELPHGTHKIKWTVQDGCGNQTVCEYVFTVRDCQAPVVKCTQDLSINLTPALPQVTIQDMDMLQSATDNCTPSAQLQYGIRKAGTGAGFPAGQSNVTFNCGDVGAQPVELWAMDAAGNSSFCQAVIIVADPNNLCGPNPGPAPSGFVLYQNQPNPWSERTSVRFHLPEASEATLRVYDAMGRALYTHSASFKKGDNTFDLKDWQPSSDGVLFYSVETPTDRATLRMAVQKR